MAKMIATQIEKFFAYLTAREKIRLLRASSAPRPWSQNRIFQENRFCNVFREDDRTTLWFREHVRDPMRDRPEVLLATVVFRMFNRIETGRAIFLDDDLLGGHSAFDHFLETGKTGAMRAAILRRIGRKGPYVTGAYIISTPPGFTKLDGVLGILRRFYKNKKSGTRDKRFIPMDWLETACMMIGNEDALLQASWDWFKEHDYLGPFHSYEIVTDLRHTALLDRAPDINSWANPGPGARRGLRRLRGWTKKGGGPDVERGEMLSDMCQLLLHTRELRLWGSTRRFEMREIEHGLCEFDKYERLRLGEGRVKGRFR